MPSKVFISWSGPQSKEVALALRDWIPSITTKVSLWLSSESLEAGKPWFEEIGKALRQSQFCIACMTSENEESSWIAFEAAIVLGASGQPGRVLPLIFRSVDLQGPLKQFQGVPTTKAGIQHLLRALNQHLGRSAEPEDVIRHRFDTFWPELKKKFDIIERSPLEPKALPAVLRAFSKRQEFSSPLHLRTFHFQHGFESHALYETSCTIAKKRLLIFGRKNRKLFDKDHLDFFHTLPAKLEKGFVFQCLFLSPRAPSHVLASAHRDPSFVNDLSISIEAAIRTLETVGLEPTAHLKAYTIQRSFQALILDDAVLHTHIRYHHENRVPEPLTKCSFSVDGIKSNLGSDILEEFQYLWETGTSIRQALEP